MDVSRANKPPGTGPQFPGGRSQNQSSPGQWAPCLDLGLVMVLPGPSEWCSCVWLKPGGYM